MEIKRENNGSRYLIEVFKPVTLSLLSIWRWSQKSCGINSTVLGVCPLSIVPAIKVLDENLQKEKKNKPDGEMETLIFIPPCLPVRKPVQK